MRLNATRLGSIASSRSFGDQLDDLAGQVPSLDLNFAQNKSLIDDYSGTTLVTHTRASSGTYVGSDGVLQAATTNLLLRSEEFDTTWVNTESSENINVAVAPNGTTTADALVDTVNNSHHNVSQSVAGLAGSTSYTLSCYMKKGSKDFGSLIFGPNASWGTGGGASVFFDLTNGTISASTSATGTIQALPNGWYRCTATATTVASPGTVTPRVSSSLNGSAQTYEGNGDEAIYIWGAQLEQSATVGEYIPTTSTINSAPRFDHDPTTGESLGLLVEEQRTNSIANNTMVGAVAGTPGTLPTNWPFQVSTNGLAVSIVGTGTELGITYLDWKISGTTTALATANICFGRTAALTGQTWTSSVYVKLVSGSLSAVTTTFVRIVEEDASTNFIVGGSGAITLPTTASLGTQRGSFTRTLSGGATTAFVRTNLAVTVSSGSTVDFTLRIGLPQLERGAFATSVIPTTTAAVTRSADVASITGSAFSGWYNAAEGTVFADFNGTNITSGQFPRILEFNNGTSSNTIRVSQYNAGANSVRVSAVTATVTQFAADNGSVAVGVRGKTAFGSALNDAALVTNGASPTTDATYLVPIGLTQLGIGGPPGSSSSVFNSTIRRLTFWPARLPNETLQTITQ